MRYTISHISRLTGFSVSGIRYYEQAGVISPVRGANGKYRDFSLHELQLLLECKQYRDCGFSLPESVELLNHAKVTQVKEHVDLLLTKLRQVINEKQLLYDLLSERNKEIDCLLQAEPCCQLMERPALYRFKLWQPGAAEGSHTPYALVQDLFDLTPFITSSLVISREDFLGGSGSLITDWGIAIDERYVRGLNFDPGPWGIYFPAMRCVRTVVNIDDELCIPAAQLEHARQFIAGNKLEVAGPALTRLFYLTNYNEKLQRIDQLWIPVKPVP